MMGSREVEESCDDMAMRAGTHRIKPKDTTFWLFEKYNVYVQISNLGGDNVHAEVMCAGLQRKRDTRASCFRQAQAGSIVIVVPRNDDTPSFFVEELLNAPISR